MDKSIIVVLLAALLVAPVSGAYHSMGVALPPSGLIVLNQTRALEPAGYMPSDFVTYKEYCGALMNLSCVDPAIFGVIQQAILNPHLFTDAWEIQENWDYDQEALKAWADAPVPPIITVEDQLWGESETPKQLSGEEMY